MCLNLLVAFDGLCSGFGDRDLTSNLSNFKVFLAFLRAIIEQVLQFLTIDLDHADTDFESELIIVVCIDSLEKLLGALRDNTNVIAVTELGVRLSRTSLAVGKKGGVETTPSLLKNSSSEQFPSLILVTVI